VEDGLAPSMGSGSLWALRGWAATAISIPRLVSIPRVVLVVSASMVMGFGFFVDGFSGSALTLSAMRPIPFPSRLGLKVTREICALYWLRTPFCVSFIYLFIFFDDLSIFLIFYGGSFLDFYSSSINNNDLIS
jgi:hypothetical protein